MSGRKKITDLTDDVLCRCLMYFDIHDISNLIKTIETNKKMQKTVFEALTKIISQWDVLLGCFSDYK